MALLRFRYISLEDWLLLETKDPNTRYIVCNEDDSIYGEFIGEEKVTAEVEARIKANEEAIEGFNEDRVDTLTYKGTIDTWDEWFNLEDGLYSFDEDGVSDTLGHGPQGTRYAEWSSLMKYKGLYGVQAIAFTAHNREMWTCTIQEGDSSWQKVSYSGNTLDFKGELTTWDGWRNLPVGMYSFVSGDIPYTTSGPNVERQLNPWENEQEASKERQWASLLITSGYTGKNAIAMSAGNKETWTCTVNGSTETWERLTKARDTLAYRGMLDTWPETPDNLPVGIYSLSDAMPRASGMPPQLEEEFNGYSSMIVMPALLGVDIYLSGLYNRELWMMQNREGDGVWQRILPVQQVGGTDYQSASSWAKVAEVPVPLGSFQRQSITFLVTSENTTSTAAERYAGILELNTHETPASAVLRWLVVSGFGLSNFNLRVEGNMLSIWVLPTIKGISFTLLSSTSAGREVDNVKLFYRYAGATRTGTSLGNSEKANIQDIADILSGATATASELRLGNRVIKQVNQGVDGTDAVNVDQLREAVEVMYWQGMTDEKIGDIVADMLGQPRNSERLGDYNEGGLCTVYEFAVRCYNDNILYEGRGMIHIPNNTESNFSFYINLVSNAAVIQLSSNQKLSQVVEDAQYFDSKFMLRKIASDQERVMDQS